MGGRRYLARDAVVTAGVLSRFHPRFVDTLVAIPDIIGSTPDRDSSKIRLNSV